MSNVVGAWRLTTDWGCDGSITGSFDQTFNADGTWTAGGSNGRWFQVEGMVVWSYNSPAGLRYSANLSGSWMAGIQGYTDTTGLKGCFGGVRAGVPAAKAAGKGVDPLTGKAAK